MADAPPVDLFRYPGPNDYIRPYYPPQPTPTFIRAAEAADKYVKAKAQNEQMVPHLRKLKADVRAKDLALGERKQTIEYLRSLLELYKTALGKGEEQNEELRQKLLDTESKAQAEINNLQSALDIERQAHEGTVRQLQVAQDELSGFAARHRESLEILQEKLAESERMRDNQRETIRSYWRGESVDFRTEYTRMLENRNMALSQALDAIEKQLMLASEAAGKVLEEAGPF